LPVLFCADCRQSRRRKVEQDARIDDCWMMFALLLVGLSLVRG
jgi:hypothetical protein